MAERPGQAEARFPARDGFPLRGLWASPEAAPVAAAIVAPATGVPARFYLPFARALAESGVAVLVPDYRGIGSSRPSALKGLAFRRMQAGFGTWARLDLPGAIDALLARHPGLPFFYIGHSLGGQVLPLVPQASRAAACLLVASQVGWVGHWRGLPTLRKYLGLMAGIGATTLALGYGPGRVFGGEDLPGRAALEWGAWGLHPGYLAGWHRDARARAATLTAPMAFVRITDDLDFAPPPAVRALMGWYPNAPRDELVFGPEDVGQPRLGHFGFFREAIGRPLWSQAIAWLHAAGLPDALTAPLSPRPE